MQLIMLELLCARTIPGELCSYSVVTSQLLLQNISSVTVQLAAVSVVGQNIGMYLAVRWPLISHYINNVYTGS